MVITTGISDWLARLQRPLEQRIDAAPAHFIEYYTLVSALTGTPYRLSESVIEADFLIDVRQAVNELPSNIQSQLESRLLGIYFATGLGSTGITDVVLNENGELLGLLVLLDIDVLKHKTANEWASWKDNIPFNLDVGYTLETRIADEPNNNRKNAIQFILLHEFGHVLSAMAGIVPDWWLDPQAWPSDANYTFLDLAWQRNADGSIQAQANNDFPLRERIAFYQAAQSSNDELISLYRDLQKTSFPTLYGATNVYDDFAESFAVYVHTELLNKPYSICIQRHQETLMQLDTEAWAQRSPEKQAFFQHWLAV